MIPSVGIFVTCFFWIPVLGQDEILIDGLPEKCGNRPPLQPPPVGYTGAKRETPTNSWPWQVGLTSSIFGPYPFCGGTLISPRWVLTAAHCIQLALRCVSAPFGKPFSYKKVSNHTLAVFIGGHNWKNDKASTYFVRVKHIIMHPDFPEFNLTKGFDFALLKLQRAVERSQQVSFACLPKAGFKFGRGNVCHIAGWGLIPNPPKKLSQTQAEVLMEKPARIALTSNCQYHHPEVEEDKHVCVRQDSGTSCAGDGGGALNCVTMEGIWLLYGVATYVDHVCDKKHFVTVSTSSALTWIKETIQKYN